MPHLRLRDGLARGSPLRGMPMIGSQRIPQVLNTSDR